MPVPLRAPRRAGACFCRDYVMLSLSKHGQSREAVS